MGLKTNVLQMTYVKYDLLWWNLYACYILFSWPALCEGSCCMNDTRGKLAKRIWRAVGCTIGGGQGVWGNPSMPPRQTLGTSRVSNFMTNYTGTHVAAGKARRLSGCLPFTKLCGLYFCTPLFQLAIVVATFAVGFAFLPLWSLMK